MKSTYTLIHKDGTKEEKQFIDGKISEHISRGEFSEHDSKGVPRYDVSVEIFEPLVQLFEATRGKIGKPITINSGYRSKEKQAELYKNDKKGVAKPGFSPHQHGAAMDLAIPAGYTAEKFAKLLRDISIELGFPAARTGWIMYGGRFVHCDLVHMLFKPYTDQKNPQPGAWKAGVTW